jgi:putative hydrolase of HD superfamily
MDIEATLHTLLHGIQLKQTARTGWGQRGVPNAESVAAHSFGVAFVVVVLAPQLDQPLDLARALTMAVLHDLPEALTSDIPTPAWRLMPDGVKPKAEEQAIQRIIAGAEGGETLLALWHELQDGQTTEARLVHDADKIDLYMQALVYEQQSGNRRLAEFWQKPADLYFPQAEALVEALRRRRL